MNNYDIKAGPKFFKAFAKFQAEALAIPKSKQGYGYKYAELKTILNLVKPLLSQNGLILMQPLQGSTIDTILVHAESGEGIVSSKNYEIVSLKGMNNYQSEGAGISYMRRYALGCLLGIVSDEDVDATTAHVEQPKPVAKKEPAKPVAKKTAKELPVAPKDGPRKIKGKEQALMAKGFIEKHGIPTNKWELYFSMTASQVTWMQSNVNI